MMPAAPNNNLAIGTGKEVHDSYKTSYAMAKISDLVN